MMLQPLAATFGLLFFFGVAFSATYTFDTKADWDDLYEIGAEGAWGVPAGRSEVQLQYHRFVLKPAHRNDANNIARVLGWDSNTHVMIYHCGFCWISEVLNNELGIDATSIQQSAYIQDSKSSNEDVDLTTNIEAVGLDTNVGDGLTIFNAFRNSGLPRSSRPTDILDETLDTVTSRQNLRTRLGQNYEVVTYEALCSLDDAEVVALGARLDRATNGRITHFIFTGTDVSICSPTPCFTFRSLDRLKELLPNHGFIDRQTLEYRP